MNLLKFKLLVLACAVLVLTSNTAMATILYGTTLTTQHLVKIDTSTSPPTVTDFGNHPRDSRQPYPSRINPDLRHQRFQSGLDIRHGGTNQHAHRQRLESYQRTTRHGPGAERHQHTGE